MFAVGDWGYCIVLRFEAFLRAQRSAVTRGNYDYWVRRLVGDPDKFLDMVMSDRRGAEAFLIEKIISKREVWKASTIAGYLSGVKSFLDYEEESLNWKKIKKTFPKPRFVSSDRPPTPEEIRRLLDICDLRIKTAVLIMCSSGIRLGAFDWLSVGDYARLSSGVGRLRVYRGEDEEYFSFLTPEACDHLDRYLEVRLKAGEEVDKGAPLIREKYDSNVFGIRRDVRRPIRVQAGSVGNLIYRNWVKTGIKRVGDGYGQEFKSDHGFRKFFETRASQAMRAIDVDVLMNHSLGVKSSYYKPDMVYLEKEYLKAAPSLTISEVEEVKREMGGQLKAERGRITKVESDMFKVMSMMDQFKKRLGVEDA